MITKVGRIICVIGRLPLDRPLSWCIISFNIIDVQNVVNGRIVGYIQLDGFTWPLSDVEVLAGVFGGKPRPQSSRTVVSPRKQPALAASTINSQL